MGGVSDEYALYYHQYKQEYGEKVCVFMKVGSFYNFYEMQENPIEYTSLLNVQIMKKKETEINDPDKAGFPTLALNKYLPVLLDNGYTVVIVDGGDAIKNEVGKRVKRYVSGIYSPSIQPIDQDIQNTSDDCSLTSILLELISSKDQVCIIYSVININMQTNTFDVYENSMMAKTVENVFDEIYRVLASYKTKELLVNIVNNKKGKVFFDKEYFCQYFDMPSFMVQWNLIDCNMERHKEYSNVQFQNMYLQKVYPHVDFGMLDPINYFDMAQNQASVTNMLYILDFISRHDIKYLNQIATPNIIHEYNHLVLQMNTLHQLNILPQSSKSIGSSLFDIINKTQTAIGKRGLKSLLCKPFRNVADINNRYKISDSILACNNENAISKILASIGDFERLHRKMSLQILNPHEFVRLHTAYESILRLNNVLIESNISHTSQNLVQQLEEFMKKYTATFDISEMKQYSLNEVITLGNYFNKGCVEELDIIQGKIINLEEALETIRQKLEQKLVSVKKRDDGDNWIKLAYSDEGYHFICSNIRLQLLKKKMEKEEWSQYQVKQNTSNSRLTSTELDVLSNQLINYRELFGKKIKNVYEEKLKEYYDQYCTLFKELKQFVELIDIAVSNVKCRKMYKYCKAEILECDAGDESSFEAKELRHPIIERIKTDTRYVSNDIVLDKDNRGMILYALNSCGKSSLLRSVGLCVVMAQCGLYVPCSEFKLIPFESIISQVEMHDNLWKGQSSFITEIVGLRKILKVANNKCLVLSDELTKGTEVVSATSLFAASALSLEQKQSKFIFTTHLQDVAKLDMIKACKKIRVCHLSVNIQDDEIIFERKLKEGPCSELYGLEVAQALGLEKNLIEVAFNIRDCLVNRKSEIVSAKKSRYNKKKIVDMCEICSYAPVKKTDMPLDTHHIQFQCEADSDNFIGSYHKNSSFNLVVLCKKCHQEVHSGVITIQGYTQTTSGTKLSFTLNRI